MKTTIGDFSVMSKQIYECDVTNVRAITDGPDQYYGQRFFFGVKSSPLYKDNLITFIPLPVLFLCKTQGYNVENKHVNAL